MIKILLLFVIDYLEFVWKYFQEPIIFLTIQQCKTEQTLSSMSNIRSFLFAQYEKIVTLLLNFSLITKKQQQCHLYKINLHIPIILFILKCGCITYCLLVLRKILVELYEKQCYFILQKQTKPFVHIRSVALISKK
jgi:hypothetical protein